MNLQLAGVSLQIQDEFTKFDYEFTDSRCQFIIRLLEFTVPE